MISILLDQHPGLEALLVVNQGEESQVQPHGNDNAKNQSDGDVDEMMSIILGSTQSDKQRPYSGGSDNGPSPRARVWSSDGKLAGKPKT